MKKLITSFAFILSTSITLSAQAEGNYSFKSIEKNTPHHRLFNKVDKMSIYKKVVNDNIECWIQFEREGITYSTEHETTTESKFRISPVRACMKAEVANSYL